MVLASRAPAGNGHIPHWPWQGAHLCNSVDICDTWSLPQLRPPACSFMLHLCFSYFRVLDIVFSFPFWEKNPQTCWSLVRGVLNTFAWIFQSINIPLTTISTCLLSIKIYVSNKVQQMFFCKRTGGKGQSLL